MVLGQQFSLYIVVELYLYWYFDLRDQLFLQKAFNISGHTTVLFFSPPSRVEAGKNTSTVIPASRKRRQKGNPVVSGETVPADLREG
jgi:hypothetical protein